jgi:predicted  nucleic acid-binding Zn-ribbon protein
MEATQRLLELQALDTAIERLEHRRRALEEGEALAAARGAANEAERELGEARLRIDALGRDSSRLEHEVDSLRMKLAAEERRLFDGSIANAKELSSLQHEVDNLKRRIADREDELLVVMEQADEVERTARDADERTNVRRAEAERVAAEGRGELEGIDSELRERADERDRLAGAEDPELLSLYEDLRRQKKGVGAVALIDGVCQGCHEQLSAVELDHLKRADGVKRCEHCRRILVL